MFNMNDMIRCSNDESLYIQGDPMNMSEHASIKVAFVPCQVDDAEGIINECASKQEIE